MKLSLKVGIIGDFDSDYPSHIATNESLVHAANSLSVAVEHYWLPTESLDNESSEASALLVQSDALWCSPGSPYRSFSGALRGVEFARQEARPFIGT